MENLLSTPDFNGLPYLQKLEISNCDKLEEIHSSLGNHRSLEYVSVRSCKKLRMFPMIVQMKNLETLEIENCYSILELPKIQSNMESLVRLSMKRIRKRVLPSSVKERHKQLETVFHQFTRKLNLSSLQKLNLGGWGLKDEEIPSDIGELYNLEELDLSQNDFSGLGFSLTQLARLKILILSKCKRLVELPELPSSIAVLEADECESLTTIGNNFHTNFKWLCKVSLITGSIVKDAGRLLVSMFQGRGIENHCRVLRVQGIEIPKKLSHWFASGNTRTLQLPENWCNDFCGFIMCAVSPSYIDFVQIRMEHVMCNEMGMDSRYDVAWEENADDPRTWVGHVPFGLIKNTDPRTCVGYVPFGLLHGGIKHPRLFHFRLALTKHHVMGLDLNLFPTEVEWLQPKHQQIIILI